MGTQLTAHQPTEQAPEAASLALIDTMRCYRSKIEWHPSGHYSISEAQTPRPDERAAMVQRRTYLVASLTPADPRAVAQKVGQAFLRFPSSRVPDGIVTATVAAYAAELAKYPLWVIDGGFLAAINGKSAPAFMPSALEWKSGCEDTAAAARKEIAEIDRILNAAVVPEVTDAHRAKMRKGFEDLLAELRLNEPFHKAAPMNTPLDPVAVTEKLTEERDSLPPAMPGPLLRAKLWLSEPEMETAGAFK